MSLFGSVLAGIALATAAGAVASLVLAVVGRWAMLRTVARVTVIAGAIQLALVLLLLAPFWIAPAFAANLLGTMLQAVAPEVDQRARVLAETISAIMNCSALSVLAALLAAPFWLLARSRLRRGPLPSR